MNSTALPVQDHYLLNYFDIKEGSVSAMLSLINALDGIALKELKVLNLTYHNGSKIYPGTGVYIFRKEKQILYVGKCSSSSFTERIPKHFDFRSYAWMNRLLKLICIKVLNLKVNDKNLMLASEYAFENLNLILINFRERERINRIERLLRACSNPLNKFKYLKVSNMDGVVDKY